MLPASTGARSRELRCRSTPEEPELLLYVENPLLGQSAVPRAESATNEDGRSQPAFDLHRVPPELKPVAVLRQDIVAFRESDRQIMGPVQNVGSDDRGFDRHPSPAGTRSDGTSQSFHEVQGSGDYPHGA